MSDMPDIIYRHNKTYGDEKYHHDRVLHSKDAEIERLKGKFNEPQGGWMETAFQLMETNETQAAENARLREAIKNAMVMIGARMDNFSAVEKEVSVNQAWHVLDQALSAANEILGGK